MHAANGEKETENANNTGIKKLPFPTKWIPPPDRTSSTESEEALASATDSDSDNAANKPQMTQREIELDLQFEVNYESYAPYQ